VHLHAGDGEPPAGSGFGPLLDRLEIHAEVQRVGHERLSGDQLREASSAIRERVERERERLARRSPGTPLMTNADMGPAEVRRYCPLDQTARALLRAAMRHLHGSVQPLCFLQHLGVLASTRFDAVSQPHPLKNAFCAKDGRMDLAAGFCYDAGQEARMNTPVVGKVIEQVRALPVELQWRVLEFTRALAASVPHGVPGRQLVRFSGIVPPDDVRQMRRAIENGCEAVDPTGWQLPAQYQCGHRSSCR